MTSVRWRIPWRVRPSTWRVAWWAFRSYRSAGRQLRNGIVYPRVGAPPRTPLSAGIGLEAAMTRVDATCLESALVRQRWLAAHGERRDIVIGVPANGLHDEPAHAWLDGTDSWAASTYLELHRLSEAAQ